MGFKIKQMEKVEQIDLIKYSEEELKQISEDKSAILGAKDQRESPHDEFDGMTYSQYFESNEKGANTYIAPKKDKYDNNFQSGTIRNKLISVASAANNLNLSPDISAYDQDSYEISKLGNGIEQVVYKTEELEVDEEKKIYRIFELLKQGDIFIEEVLTSRKTIERKLNGFFDGTIRKQWTERLVNLPSLPERNIISGLGVYLDDIRYPIGPRQPGVTTIEVVSYDVAERIFGGWERWKYVPKTKIVSNEIRDDVRYGWNVAEVGPNQVEIIRRQKKTAQGNFYSIYINGVLMTPVGLPFLWKWDDYNIVQQGLEPISSHFAYHKSLPARLRTNVAIYDEIMRLAVLLTQKAAEPARANLSGRILSSKIFMPRSMVTGISPNQVPVLDEKGSQGVTAPIMQMLEKLDQTNDYSSVTPQFQGQTTGKEMTATESLQLKEQAKQSLGIIINMVSLMEYKLAWLRLYNILGNWFNPIDTVVDEARNMLVNKYRTVTRQVPIEGVGLGNVIVRPTDEPKTEYELKEEEDTLEKQTGKPTRIISLNMKTLDLAKVIWQIAIRPREKVTSELGKLMVERFMSGLAFFGPTVNIGTVQEEYAKAWEKDPNKLFNRTNPNQNPTETPDTKTQMPNVPQMDNMLPNLAK